MQGAHIKTMGVVKPWAPPGSYGLVIRLSASGVPLYALHSRVDGVNHGVVAAVELDGSLVAIAKGPGRLLGLPPTMIEGGVRGLAAPSSTLARRPKSMPAVPALRTSIS